METIDSLIASYEEKLKKLKAVKEILGSDPVLANDVASIITSGHSTTTRVRLLKDRPKRVTQFERIKEHLAHNEWQTIDEIAIAIGVARGSVAPLLYRNEQVFESRRHPVRPKMVQWNLTNRKRGDAT